jgi:hypothetical protein
LEPNRAGGEGVVVDFVVGAQARDSSHNFVHNLVDLDGWAWLYLCFLFFFTIESWILNCFTIFQRFLFDLEAFDLFQA